MMVALATRDEYGSRARVDDAGLFGEHLTRPPLLGCQLRAGHDCACSRVCVVGPARRQPFT